jgi:hypothetical protein
MKAQHLTGSRRYRAALSMAPAGWPTGAAGIEMKLGREDGDWQRFQNFHPGCIKILSMPCCLRVAGAY